MMDWEVFSKMGTRGAGREAAIRHSGEIVISKRVCDDLNADYVELLFDAANRRIGIRATSSTNPNSFEIKSYPRMTSRGIRAANFLKYYGIDYVRGSRYLTTTEDRMTVICLDRPLLDAAAEVL